MAQKIRNPLAQSFGLVLQSTRDKMGGISSSDIASQLGLAASHYRMIEAGSAILQPARAIKLIQTFDTIEYVPLCQTLVAIQLIDSAKNSIDDMKTITALVQDVNPPMVSILDKFKKLWSSIKSKQASQVARLLTNEGIVKELENFLTTEPISFTADQINNFMTPTYNQPISGQLYNKIGNILQGVAPFYLDTILQLVDNLKGITPRVTPDELAKWEFKHKTRITHIIGILRNPDVILDVNTFDYSFLWQDNFEKLLIVHQQESATNEKDLKYLVAKNLGKRYSTERLKYEANLQNLDSVITKKLTIHHASKDKGKVEKLLFHRDAPMNNLWLYLMDSGYVVPFIDNATLDNEHANLYGTSLAYDETCEKLSVIKELCSNAGFTL